MQTQQCADPKKTVYTHTSTYTAQLTEQQTGQGSKVSTLTNLHCYQEAMSTMFSVSSAELQAKR